LEIEDVIIAATQIIDFLRGWSKYFSLCTTTTNNLLSIHYDAVRSELAKTFGGVTAFVRSLAEG
jgi:hypothetical protein